MGKMYAVELTFEQLAIVIVSLELRLLNHTFNTRRDERTAKALKEILDSLLEEKEGGENDQRNSE